MPERARSAFQTSWLPLPLRWLRLPWAVTEAGLGLLAACNSPESPSTQDPPITASAFAVSNPVPSDAAAGIRIPDRWGASGAEVVYVSLPQGSIPAGSGATLRVRRTGATAYAPVIAGGFDPVALPALVGDTLDVSVVVNPGATPLAFVLTVALRARPIVVRTDPPPRKRDVPLNASMLVVFSEPIAVSSLGAGSIQLRTGGSVVPGQLSFGDATRLTATFQPAAPLAPETDYELVISQGVRDGDGETLEAPVSVPFTTGAAPPATRLAFVGTPVTMLAGWAQPTAIHVQVLDALGRPFTRFTGAIRLTLGANSAGAVLSGTTEVLTDTTGVASFTNLTVSRSGAGFTLIASASGLSNAQSPSFEVKPGPAGRIAFTSFVGGSNRLYLLDLSTSTVSQLTNDIGSEPAWSPDGRKIAFDGVGGINVMNADGSGATMINSHGHGPAWSPDGGRIAFLSDGAIFVMNADGSAESVLVAATPNLAPYGGVAWSRDGRTIAFHADSLPSEESLTQVYLMNPDGSGVHRLTGPCFYSECGIQSAESYPSWSPDGSSIIFWSFVFGITATDRNQSVGYSLSGDDFFHGGSGSIVFDSNPDWSPDAKWIVFVKDRQLWVLLAGTPGPMWRLTNLPTGAFDPAWAPVP